MNAQCTVFAESEVVSLIHANTPPADIARAVHDAMASRVSAMVRRIGVDDPVVLGGGAALNVGFVKSLSEALGGVDVEVLPSRVSGRSGRPHRLGAAQVRGLPLAQERALPTAGDPVRDLQPLP